ncbi:MAG: hypothetical protein M9962_00545 [Oligoflexia bacterium]|nr:hypothetical protein [Oligoflexia bacterium]
MKAFFICLFSVFVTQIAHGGFAVDIYVPRFETVLENVGDSIQCEPVETPGYGYLIEKKEEGIFLIPFSAGKPQPEERHLWMKVKDYGDPLTTYLSHYKRDGEYGSYFELLIFSNYNFKINGVVGYAMFTEAFYTKKEDGSEHETLKPLAKPLLSCTVL